MIGVTLKILDLLSIYKREGRTHYRVLPEKEVVSGILGIAAATAAVAVAASLSPGRWGQVLACCRLASLAGDHSLFGGIHRSESTVAGIVVRHKHLLNY